MPQGQFAHRLAVEHGELDIDAIASIGHTLDSARCVAARRRIPYIALTAEPGSRIDDLCTATPTYSTVLHVQTCHRTATIALRTVELEPSGSLAQPGTPTMLEPATIPRSGCRIAVNASTVLYIDRRAMRLPANTTVTVHRYDHRLVEYTDHQTVHPSVPAPVT